MEKAISQNISEENTKQLKIMSENFKFLRQTKGWSIQELSEVSGINKKILTGMEKDQDFDIEYLFILCRIYKSTQQKRRLRNRPRLFNHRLPVILI